MSHAQRVLQDAEEAYAATERQTERWSHATDYTLPAQAVLAGLLCLSALWKAMAGFTWWASCALLCVSAWNGYALIQHRRAWKRHSVAFTELLAAQHPEEAERIRALSERLR